MKQKLLLLEDVDSLGIKGDIVSARPGYVRNFLLPRGLAAVATPNVLRKQEALRKEREEQVRIDRKESESLAQKLGEISLEITVKVDPEGRMYGSVGIPDILALFAEKGFELEKRFLQMTRPIKETGNHKVSLKLKGDVICECMLTVLPEGAEVKGHEDVSLSQAEPPEEMTPE